MSHTARTMGIWTRQKDRPDEPGVYSTEGGFNSKVNGIDFQFMSAQSSLTSSLGVFHFPRTDGAESLCKLVMTTSLYCAACQTSLTALRQRTEVRCPTIAIPWQVCLDRDSTTGVSRHVPHCRHLMVGDSSSRVIVGEILIVAIGTDKMLLHLSLSQNISTIAKDTASFSRPAGPIAFYEMGERKKVLKTEGPEASSPPEAAGASLSSPRGVDS